MASLGPIAPDPTGIAGSPTPFHLAAHGLSVGDGPFTATTTGTLPAPLAGATPYYAVPTGDDDLNLADSHAHALTNTVVKVTARGAGVHTLVTGAALNQTPLVYSSTFTAAASDVVTTAAPHGFGTGDGPLRATKGADDSFPAPLAAATPYYSIVVTPGTFKFADSKAHALAGTAIDITTAGVGVNTLITGAAVHEAPISFSHTFTVGSTPGNTVYDVGTLTQNTVVAVNTVIQAALVTADDYTPVDAFACDEAAADTCVGCDDGPGIPLVSSSAGVVVTVASPHGHAAPQVANADNWTTAETTLFAHTTNAFAFAARVKFTAKPAGQSGWLARGTAASAHYRMTIDASGFPAMAAKQSGGESSASVAVDITDGAWRWIVGGRTVTGELLWITLVDGSATTAFANTKDLTNAGGVFGLWAGSVAGGVACEVDHLIGWSGTQAETVYANRAALLTALGAAAPSVTDQFATFVGAHGIVDGDGPFRATTTVTLPAGIPAATDLWGIATGHAANELGIATSYANAIANTPVTITDAGTGVQTLGDNGTAVHTTAVALVNGVNPVVDPTYTVNPTTNVATIGITGGLSSGDGPFTVTNPLTAAALPAGLVAATGYYSIPTGASTLKLADSYAHAVAGTPVDITDAGHGTHTLTATGAAIHWTPVALADSTFTVID